MMPMLLPLMIYVVKGLERLALLVRRVALGNAENSCRERRSLIWETVMRIGVIMAMAGAVLMLLWMVYGIAMPIYCQLVFPYFAIR